MNEQMINSATVSPEALNPPILNLRDIHLPEPISWWPIAPGWWFLIVSLLLILIILFVSRKVYKSKQLKRDISSELDNIKQQFQQTQNKSQLAKSLSMLLRRSSITYYPKTNIAGLTGNNWLAYLDNTNTKSSGDRKFQSDIGKVLLTAPYLPEDNQSNENRLDFDAQKLITLCESWLTSSHNKTLVVQPS